MDSRIIEQMFHICQAGFSTRRQSGNSRSMIQERITFTFKGGRPYVWGDLKMDLTLPPELERLKTELDGWVVQQGWSTWGYYFDDSPFDGVHLVKSANSWILYWKEPGPRYAERRYINLQDAYLNMKEVISSMKRYEGPHPDEIGRSLETPGYGTGHTADDESAAKGTDPDGDLTDFFGFILGQIFVLIPWFLICGPLLIIIWYVIEAIFQ